MDQAPAPPSQPAHPRRRYAGWIWLIVIVAAGYGLWRYRQVALPAPASTAGGRHGAAQAKVPVVAVAARGGNVPVYLRNIGTVTPNYTVTLHPLVGGEIIDVNFQEGQFVNKGDLLIQIDPRPYQAALAQAQGALAHDTALYNDDEIDYQRYLALYQQNVISKQQVDSQQALVNEYKGAMVSDQANIDTAQLNLAYSRITAPITGRIGLRQVDPGNVVQAGTATGLAVITQVQPIAVLFNLPQEDLQQVYPQLRAGEHPRVAAFDSSNTKELAEGELETIDDTIDPTTGTFRCKAMFPNANNALFPDQFVNMRMLVGNDGGLTIVPPAAIQRGPNGTYVFVVSAKNTVSVRQVTEKLTEGNQAGLSDGLKPGERVVVDGADKLQDGSQVSVTTESLGAPLTMEAMGAASKSVAPPASTPPVPTSDPATRPASPSPSATPATPSSSGPQHRNGSKKPISH